jgi:signal transduction histidine kinase
VSRFRASALNGLRWISYDGVSGAVTVRDAEGVPVAGMLDRDAARLFTGPAIAGGEVVLRFVAPGGAVTSLHARLVPGAPGLAVAIAATESESRLAPIVETIVNQIAHDVRNYAFTIGLQAELGDRRAGASAEVKGHFAAILRQIDTLKAYLEQLLLYGRPMSPHPAAVDLASLIGQQVQALRTAWRPDAPPPDISVEVAADIGTVRWDARLIGHALRALLDNAVRSADPTPPVVVRAVRDGDRVDVEVADRGSGLPAENEELVWLPMRVRRHGGAGLGLAVVRKIVTAHGGDVDLATGAAGTTVRLNLPREVAGA